MRDHRVTPAGLADVDWTCEKAGGLLLRRAGQSGGPKRSLLAALALAVVLAAGCSGDDGGSDSGDVPEGAVATVGDVEIADGELERQVDALARSRGRGAPAQGSASSDDPVSASDGSDDAGGAGGSGSGAAGAGGGSGGSGGGSDGSAGSGGSVDADPGSADPERAQLEAQALSLLVREQALEQEAAERGIEVDDAEIRRRWRAVRQSQFSGAGELRRFLGGQTVAEVLDQLRLQELTERIHQQVREQADGNPDKAVARFQQDFQRRWSDRTSCAEPYADSAAC